MNLPNELGIELSNKLFGLMFQHRSTNGGGEWVECVFCGEFSDYVFIKKEQKYEPHPINHQKYCFGVRLQKHLDSEIEALEIRKEQK